MDWTSLLAASGIGAGGGSALIVFMIKRWIKQLDTTLEKQGDKIDRLVVQTAEQRGKDDLVWREINTDKQKIVKLQSSVEKLWETITGLTNPRVSDLIKKSLDDK